MSSRLGMSHLSSKRERDRAQAVEFVRAAQPNTFLALQSETSNYCCAIGARRNKKSHS